MVKKPEGTRMCPPQQETYCAADVARCQSLRATQNKFAGFRKTSIAIYPRFTVIASCTVRASARVQDRQVVSICRKVCDVGCGHGLRLVMCHGFKRMQSRRTVALALAKPVAHERNAIVLPRFTIVRECTLRCPKLPTSLFEILEDFEPKDR